MNNKELEMKAQEHDLSDVSAEAIAETTKAVAEEAVTGYKKIERCVVDGYKKIRTQYTEKQHTELDDLKALDAKVKRPANVFAYTYGSVGAIVMGGGMSMALSKYPIYKRILNKRKKKFAPEIMEFSDKVLGKS